MDVESVFHMTGGTGLTSYTKNSSLQKKASEMVKHITLETVEKVYLSAKPKSLGIADLGCSSGPNSLSIIRDIIASVRAASRKATAPAPELIQVFLNDLPTNDFNSIFKSLPEFSRELGREGEGLDESNSSMVFIGGYPGSFYGRLFPNDSLHFVYASYSLHWLSKVPPALYDNQGQSINKGAIYIRKKSPPEVSKAYFAQFEADFSSFLRHRSEEVTCGGRMVLILVGREGPNHVDRGNSFLWEILSRSFGVLVSEGVIEEEKLDSYDVHFYAPSREEIEDKVKREGSFVLDRFEMFEIESEEPGNGVSHGARVATTVRAIQESMISRHFGEGILDKLFEIYGGMIDEEMAKEKIRPVTFVLVLRKL